MSAITKRLFTNLLGFIFLGLSIANLFPFQAYPHSNLTDDIDKLSQNGTRLVLPALGWESLKTGE